MHEAKQMWIVDSISNMNIQFKKEYIKNKLTHIISKYSNTPVPNIYNRCTGQSLTLPPFWKYPISQIEKGAAQHLGSEKLIN